MRRPGPCFTIDGRVALVTGGDSGIGLVVATALGRSGAAVVLVARRKAELAEAAAGLEAEGIAASTLMADLALPEAAEVIRRGLAARGMTPDMLVNAAGVNLRQRFADVTPDAFDLHIAMHLRAPFLLTQALAPAMAARGSGRILHCASLQSFRAFTDSAPYGAAKGDIAQLTRAVAEAWSPHGITCNALAPGFFPTGLTAPIFAGSERAAGLAARTCIGRNGTL